MAEELTRRGIENELITIHDGPHGFDGDSSSRQTRDALDKVLIFLRQHLVSA